MKIQKLIISWFRVKIKLLSFFCKKCGANVAFKIFCTPYYNLLYKSQSIDDVEQLSFAFNGKRAVGYKWRNAGRKKILIAHGFRSSAVKFKEFAQKLAEKNFEVIAFDAPAHNSSKGKQLTAIDYKDFIAEIDSKFGPFHGFLTHSFGGLAVSMHLAEMLHNNNIKTVLIAPAANSKTIIQLFFKEMRLTDKKVQDYFYNKIETLSGHNIDWFSLRRCAPFIQGEVLWIHDVNDKITPVMDALELEKMPLKNFNFIFTKELGHRRIYRDKDVVDAVINFF